MCKSFPFCLLSIWQLSHLFYIFKVKVVNFCYPTRISSCISPLLGLQNFPPRRNRLLKKAWKVTINFLSGSVAHYGFIRKWLDSHKCRPIFLQFIVHLLTLFFFSIDCGSKGVHFCRFAHIYWRPFMSTALKTSSTRPCFFQIKPPASPTHCSRYRRLFLHLSFLSSQPEFLDSCSWLPRSDLTLRFFADLRT